MGERAGLHGGSVRAGPARGLGRVGDRPRPGMVVDVTIRVVLPDDQELLRLGFRMILDQETTSRSWARPATAKEAVDLAAKCHPDVVLMDVRMPLIDGIEATRRIVAGTPTARVLVLTTFDLDAYAFGALRAGASGFLLKDVPPAELTAIRIVASGDAVVSPRITRRLLDEYAHLLASRVKRPATRATRRSPIGSRRCWWRWRKVCPTPRSPPGSSCPRRR